MFYKFYNKPGASGAGIKVGGMQSSMLFCYILQLVELFDLEIHPHTAKNMKLKQIYFAQNVVTGN